MQRQGLPQCLFVLLLSLLLVTACGEASPAADLRSAYAEQVPALPTAHVGSQQGMSSTPSQNNAEPSPVPALLPTDAPSPPTVVPTATLVQPAPTLATIPTLTTAPSTMQAADEAAVRYVFPVQPMVLGEYGTCHHDYPASDIFAPIGTSFVAVTDGVVDFVSSEDQWNAQEDGPATRGGLSVAIIGVDGVRYYGSHLLKIMPDIKPGVQVTAGQQLGEVGKSGNAARTPSHLHFGISRPTHPDDWMVRRGEINPVPYLNAWKAGEARTPDLTRTDGACSSDVPPLPELDVPTDDAGPGRVEPMPEPTPLARQHLRRVPAMNVQPAPAEVTAVASSGIAPTYRLRVTRQGMVGETTANGHVIQPNDVFVSLPCRCALSSRDGHEYQVRLSTNGRSLVVPVWDVGPYWTTDDYWNSQRDGFPDLPTGWPADHAAFYRKRSSDPPPCGWR